MLNIGTAQTDFLKEANRIASAAKSEGVLLRILGALAFNIHCPQFSYMQQVLGRSFTDIDFASYGKQKSRISGLFTRLGYVEDPSVATIFGNRMVFYELTTKRHCDVFLDKLEFCHDVPFQDRLEVDYPTVPLAELILEKMQIFKLNEKDVIDTIMLLREHQVGDSDSETINARLIARLCAKEWGLWKTLTVNLDRVNRIASSMEKLSDEDKADVSSKIKTLQARMDEEPKSTGWKMRARIGEKKKWYRDVEELSR